MPGYREDPLPPLPGRPVADDEIIVHGPPMSGGAWLHSNGTAPRLPARPCMLPAMMHDGPADGTDTYGPHDAGPDDAGPDDAGPDDARRRPVWPRCYATNDAASPDGFR